MADAAKPGLKVVVFEDNPVVQAYIAGELKDSRHELAATGRDIAEALELVRQIGDKAIEADVILLDGWLEGSKAGGSHAVQIFNAMREYDVRVKLVSISMDPLIDLVPVDVDLTKMGIIDGQLIPTLEEL
ncbi:MAG: hypothetical protein JWN82_533 [Candidatus Saccharibacteria bacterium]|nr:hypothetical protein [Candidatus Saccharibacteria bacterium]